MENPKPTVHFGILNPPLSEQLEWQGILFDPAKIDFLNNDRIALERIYDRGYLTRKSYESACSKLANNILEHLEEFKKATA